VVVRRVRGRLPGRARARVHALNVSWDANAYGSVVWLLLGLHTTHLITDTIDTACWRCCSSPGRSKASASST
jgi:heme/copper-type cytochrome/quinol oxidase subunit 3